MYDSHIHTFFSPDCKSSPMDICLSAIEKGLKGIAFTDHCFLDTYITDNSYRNILNSAKEAKAQALTFKDKLKVACGVELSEAFRKVDYSSRLIENIKPDIVLMSVHSLTKNSMPLPLSRIDFNKLSDSEIHSLLEDYFKNVLFSARETDYDVCAHLTLPLRYINGVYKKNISEEKYRPLIEKIFTVLIDRKKSLELNTSEFGRQLYDFMPGENLIKMYIDMGGKLITLGSDAHKPDKVGSDFGKAKALLKRNGVTRYVYYENRKSVFVNL